MSAARLVVALLLVTVIACGGPPPSQLPTDSVVSPFASPSGRHPSGAWIDIVAAGATRIDLTGDPDWIAVAGESAWVAVNGGVRRVDGATGEPDGLVPIPGVICLAMDIGFDSLWAASCDPPLLARIDPVAGSLDTPFIDVPVSALQREGSIGVGESGVWLVSTDHELLFLNPIINRVEGRWPLPAGAVAVRAGLGAVWVTDFDAGELLRIDPADPPTARAIDVGEGPRFLAIGQDAVWVMNQADGSVSRVDAGGSVVATIKVSDTPIGGGDIAVGGIAWVRTEQDLVVGIDVTTNEVEHRYGPPSGSGSVATDGDVVWVTAHDTSSLWRFPFP